MANDRYPPGSATAPAALYDTPERQLTQNPATGRWGWTCKLCPDRTAVGFSAPAAALDNFRVYHSHDRAHVAAAVADARRRAAGEAATA